MGIFVKGDIVVVPFPFSDLTQSKRRPALVLASPPGNDIILCQITSQKVKDNYAILLSSSDFKDGEINQESNIRPNRIFTADEKIVLYKVGKIKSEKINEVIRIVIELLSANE